MNINEFKKHLQHVHRTLDDDPENKQRGIMETHVSDMTEYKPKETKDKSTVKPTTKAGKTLNPDSKSTEKLGEGAADASAAGGGKPKKKVVVEEDEIDPSVLEYFEAYFGESLNENIFDGEIMDAVQDLILLTEAVCEAVGLEEASKSKGKGRPYKYRRYRPQVNK